MKLTLLSSLSLLASATAENQFAGRPRLTPPVVPEVEFALAASSDAVANNTGFFTQLLNHDDPSAGTFQQRYYWNSEFWKGPGSPVSSPHSSPLIACKNGADLLGRVLHSRGNFCR